MARWTVSAEIIQKLIEAGTPAALIAEVAVELGRAEADRQALSSRRENERNRKRVSREVTGSHGTGRDDTGPPFLDKESFPQTPFKEIKPIPVCVTGARKGTRISEGWLPEKHLPSAVRALTDQWPPGRYERELDGFRDYWSSRQRNAAMLDWDKGWWNRIRDQHDRIMRENRNDTNRKAGSGNGKSNDGFLSSIRTARAIREADAGQSNDTGGMRRIEGVG